MQAICAAALRTPDHGKLAPWRFIIVEENEKERLRVLLVNAFKAANPNAPESQCAIAAQFMHFDAALVIAVYSPQTNAKIPIWEQELSCGAACMNLLHAAHAHGFHPGWVTPWAGYNADVRQGLGLTVDEKIAGFIFIGTPAHPLEERPRPEPAEKISLWRG